MTFPSRFLPSLSIRSSPPGESVLDLRHTKFIVVPAAPGEALRVKAEFDVNHYDLSETFDEGTDDEGWTYEVKFKRTSDSYMLTTLKELLGGSKPRVKIYLPRDVPFDLEASFLQGGAEVDLGGLWLVNADIEFLQGGGAIEISEPTREPMDNLRIDFTQGGGALEGLGNASPRTLDVAFSMGGGYVDLRGQWQNDSEVEIEQSMGGVSVNLPNDVVIRGLKGRETAEPGEGEEKLPIIRISTLEQHGRARIPELKSGLIRGLLEDRDGDLAQHGEDQETDREDAGADAHLGQGRHVLVELAQRVGGHARDHQRHALLDVDAGVDQQTAQVEGHQVACGSPGPGTAGRPPRCRRATAQAKGTSASWPWTPL